MKIYDVIGRIIKELVNEEEKTGNYNLTFHGSQVASGIYFYQFKTGQFVDTKRMILIK
ncbi:MAG: T9SS type A sorting domain-containing protein [Ignavibacteria bacterium]|nr:T9SS type A sorting domain-containing protein [Ignavibacteria bacterium]